MLLIAATTLLFFACKHELEKPTWDVDVLVPIAHTNLSINNIIPDSVEIINEDEEGFISLIYQESLLNVDYDSLLLMETTSEETSIKIDSVDFDDVVISNQITVEEVLGVDPNGISLPISAQPHIIENDTTIIDASEYFETMTLYTGTIVIEIENNFPTDISNIEIELLDINYQNIISSPILFPLIQSGTSVSDSYDISGKTLDKNLIALIKNMDLEASNGLVPIYGSDNVITKISITEIKIMEATAYFPNQLLHEENVEESFELGSARLTEIGIKEGKVIINALSTLPDTGTIVYAIPSLTKNGLPFETIVKVPPNNNGVPTQFTFSFDGYIMDLTGEDGRDGGDTVNTIYATLKAYLDSTGELETIHQVDSFYLYNEYFFTPEYAKGYIGQDTLAFGPEIIETDIFNFIESGSIDLESAKISIAIDNYIGADAAFQINNLSALNNATEVAATIDNNPMHTIERASLTGENNINPTHTEISIEANEMLSIFPNKINTSATFYLNPNGQAATEDFLFPAYPMEANLTIEIPLSFIANELTLSNSTTLEVENTEELEILYITLNNGLPLEAKLIIIAFDETEQVVDTLMNNQQVLAALTNAEGKVTESTTSTLEIRNTDFSNVKSIKAIASFNTQPQQEYISIYSTYEMDITLSAKFRKTLAK